MSNKHFSEFSKEKYCDYINIQITKRRVEICRVLGAESRTRDALPGSPHENTPVSRL